MCILTGFKPLFFFLYLPCYTKNKRTHLCKVSSFYVVFFNVDTDFALGLAHARTQSYDPISKRLQSRWWNYRFCAMYISEVSNTRGSTTFVKGSSSPLNCHAQLHRCNQIMGNTAQGVIQESCQQAKGSEADVVKTPLAAFS